MSVFALTGNDRVLVVAAHQDDESIGCGGSLLRWRQKGVSTGTVWLSATTEGEHIGAEARAAATILGLEWTRGIGESPVGLAEDARALATIVSALRTFAPTVLVLPHEDEDDRQHRVTSRLAQEAEWIAAYDVSEHLGPPMAARPRLVLGYEVWTPMRRPTAYFDITAVADGKRAAITCYASQEQITSFSDAVLALNRYRGVMSGAGDYAEAFQILRAT